MEKKTWKYIVWGTTLGVSALTGLWVYKQVDNFMKNYVGFRKIKFLQITQQGVLKFDLWLTYINKTNISAVMTSQKYKIYSNGKFKGEAENFANTPIKGDGESIIGVLVDVPIQQIYNKASQQTLKQLAFKALDFLDGGPAKTRIKIDMELKLKIYGFIPIKVPYVYEDTLKNMM